MQLSRSYWLWYFRTLSGYCQVTLSGCELMPNYHFSITKQTPQPTESDTPCHHCLPITPTQPYPSHHLSSIRLPKCIRNEGCFINKFSPLIIYLDFEATMTTHKLIKKRSYCKSCLFSDWIGHQPFSEIIITNNKMAVATTSGREQDWNTIHLIFYVRWQTTLSLTTITFLYVVRNIVVNPIFSYVGVLPR